MKVALVQMELIKKIQKVNTLKVIPRMLALLLLIRFKINKKNEQYKFINKKNKS